MPADPLSTFWKKMFQTFPIETPTNTIYIDILSFAIIASSVNIYIVYLLQTISDMRN